MPSVRIPTPLRSLTDGQNTVDIEATTVGDLLRNLNEIHPGFSERILDEDGELRRFVNIYVDGEDIRYRDGFETELTPNNEISIVPSVAGGICRRPLILQAVSVFGFQNPRRCCASSGSRLPPIANRETHPRPRSGMENRSTRLTDHAIRYLSIGAKRRAAEHPIELLRVIGAQD